MAFKMSASFHLAVKETSKLHCSPHSNFLRHCLATKSQIVLRVLMEQATIPAALPDSEPTVDTIISY